jgi:hypothetical protein
MMMSVSMSHTHSAVGCRWNASATAGILDQVCVGLSAPALYEPGAPSPTYPVSLANVVAAGVEPHVCVSVLGAVLLAVIQYPFQDVGDGAVVAAAIARRQHNNVAVLRRPRIALPSVCMLGYAEIPLWLSLEVSGLRGVVVRCDNGDYRLGGGIVSVVLDWHVAVESEEDNENCERGDGEDYGSARQGDQRMCI